MTFTPGQRVDYRQYVGGRRMYETRAAIVQEVHDDGTVSLLVEGLRRERVSAASVYQLTEYTARDWEHRYGRGHLAAR